MFESIKALLKFLFIMGASCTLVCVIGGYLFILAEKLVTKLL